MMTILSFVFGVIPLAVATGAGAMTMKSIGVVVLGGMGSIVGVISGALLLILLPEYLRAFSEYRMLLFGAILVIMMVFKPEGIISNVRRTYTFEKNKQS